MNKAISQGFGAVLNVMHVIVIIAIVVATAAGGIPGLFIGLGVGVLYLFLVGLACTLIAIREHLETLIAQRSPPVLTVPAPKAPEVIRRREGFVNV